MPKTKISEWSSTPANNTDIDSINIAEGCAPSGINDAIRELMAQVKDLYAGTSGDIIAVAAGGTGVGTSTGSGSNVLSTSPTLITPALGTPSALVGTNITGTASGLTAGNVTTNANLTGAVTSVGNATSLGSFSSADLLGALTDETGTGSAVFANSPTLVTPILGTPTSATLTNATGLPIATGVSGLGTGIATALAVNTGSSGAPVINGGVLGTPSSGTVTNLTGTASININGTVGATTASTGAFTTLTTSSTVTHNGGTANGVTYLNGSKVLTSGSALTFDGTNLSNSGYYIGTAAVGRLTKSNTTGRNLLTGGVTGGTTDGAYIITEGYDYGGTAAGGAINLVTAGATSPISFFINGTEGMRLTSTGLGIGTSSVTYKVDVSVTGNNGIRTTSSAGQQLYLGNTGGDAVVGTLNNYSLGFLTNGSVRATLNTSGNLGLGVIPSAWALSGSSALQIKNAGVVGYTNSAYLTANLFFTSGGSTKYIADGFASYYAQSFGNHEWYTVASGTAGATFTATQAMTLDTSGNLLVGTTSGLGTSNRATLVNNQSLRSVIAIQNTSTSGYSSVELYNSSGTQTGAMGYGNASVSVTGAQDNLYLYSASAITFLSGGTSERARITSGGRLLINTTNDSPVGANVTGAMIGNNGEAQFSRDSDTPLFVNRKTNDGRLVALCQDGNVEGDISVSGTTVSYNGGHLSRWAQTTLAKDESIVKGTVLSNLDEMNVYTKDGQPVDNEQLNKVKVSDTEGDVNVAGVFVNWSHDEDHNVDEINMAMTGDMIIRIAQGVTVVRGDLLMSAGDGTAKPQGDDIIRSKTVAKVTSNHVTCTYADGSYCVPCVLMAC
jgi:hypothetical protein